MAAYSGWTRVVLLSLFAGACSGDDEAGPGASGAGGAGASSGAGGVGIDGSSGAGGPGRGGAAGDGMGGRSGTGGASGGNGAAGTGGEPSACGSTNDVGGSRVKLRVATTAEGDERALGLHDTQLDVDCRYVGVADGVGRCLPASIQSFQVAGPGAYFLDAACSGAPVYQLNEGCPPEYLLFRESTGSDPCADLQARLFARGAAVDSNAGTLYALNDGVCESASLESRNALFERGEEQELAKYAAGQWGTWASAGGLALEGYLGEDGSRDATAFHDTARGERCTPLPLEDGELHCLVGHRVSIQFGDAACEHPLLTEHYQCDFSEPPSFGFTESKAVCETYALYRALAPYAATTTFGPAPQCGEQMLPEGDLFERYTTEPADPAEMIRMQKARDPDDGGRLQREHFRNADGACFSAGAWDTELDTACAIETAQDGSLRCVPRAATYSSVATLYSEASCTTGVLYGVGDRCGEHSPFVVRSTPMGCEQRSQVWRVMPEAVPSADLPPLYAQRGAGCEPAVLSSTSVYFRVGEEVQPAEMMQASVELR